MKNPDIKKFYNYVQMTFYQKTSSRMIPNYKKDMPLAKIIVDSQGLARAMQLWDIFLTSKDEFVKSAGYTVGVFYSQINRITSSVQASPTHPTAEQHQDIGRLIDECRSFMGVVLSDDEYNLWAEKLQNINTNEQLERIYADLNACLDPT